MSFADSRNSARWTSNVESLEPRQLLAAAVSGTDLLAQFNAPRGLRALEAYLLTHPKSAFGSHIDVYKSKQLFRAGNNSTLQIAMKKGGRVESAIKLLKTVPYLRWAAPNYIYQKPQAEMTPNDPRYPAQTTGTDVIQLPQAWDHSLGNGVTVAVLDDGVDIDHEDLAANIWRNAGEIAGNGIDDDANGFIDDINGWDFGSGDNNIKPAFDQTYNFINSHGTSVAGVIGSVINNNIGMAGVAPAVKIMPVRFHGYGVTVTSAGIAQSIAYAANNGAKVINISFSIDPYMADLAFTAATDLAYSKGALWLNSAGNANVENPPRLAIEKALFIANTDNNDVRYEDSNYGAGIDLSAPGVDLMATAPGNSYTRATGTSYSTAVSSGVAALIWAKNPTWSRDQVAARLVGTADSLDAKNPAYIGKLGAGRVNALKSVSSTLAAPRVRGLAGIAEGAAIVGTPATTTLTLFNILRDMTVAGSNFELRSAGADNAFGTSDDAIVPITLTTAYAIGTNALMFTHGVLQPGKYRFTAKDTITDPFGQKLDGNADGVAGGDFVRHFSVQVSGPAAPSGLTAVVPSYSQTEAELRWTDNSTNETSFVIQRSSTPTFNVIDKTFTAAANSVRYNDWGLQQGGTYYYRVLATNTIGNSAPSNTVAVAIALPAAGIPAAPTGLIGKTPSYSQTEIELSWIDNSTNETGFIIERSTVATFATVDKTVAAIAGSNRYNDWGLTLGQAYYYRVKAVNGADASAWSNIHATAAAPVQPAPVTPPKAPSSLSAAKASATSIKLTWKDNSTDETKFEIIRSTSAFFTNPTTITVAANATTITNTGLAAKTTYYYAIRAVNAVGASSYSSVVSVRL